MPASVFERTAIAEDALREASKITAAVVDGVKEKLRTANRAVRRSRFAAEDALEGAKHAVREKPLGAVAIAFAAGLLAGSILTCAAALRRH